MDSPPVYRFEEQPNGNFSIFDVPIFSAHTEERGDDDPREFDADWLKDAVTQATKRQGEGYLAPLHVSHHGGGDKVEGAGQFKLTRVGDTVHDGETVPTIFADLVNVKPEIFKRIVKGELVYRSVEILNVNKPEIDSLALLDHETPFFRFPLLRVADAGDDKETSSGKSDNTRIVTLAAPRGGVLAYSSRGHGSRALFNFKESPMAATKSGNAPATDPTNKMADVGQILAQMNALMQALGAAMGGGQPAPGAPAPGAPAPAQAQAPAGPGPSEQPAPAMAGAPGQPMKPFAAEAVAAAEGTQDAMLARMAKIEKRLADSDASLKVEKKASELVAAGFGADQVQAFRAKATSEGFGAASAYAAGMERIGPSEPPTHWTGEIRTQAPDVDVVAAFGAQGPEALAKARDLHASYTRSGATVPFNDYVAANTDADAFLGVGRA